MANFWDNITNWSRDRKNDAENEAKKYHDNFNNWVNETQKNINIPSFYNPKKDPVTVQFGNDKSPIQFGIELKPGKPLNDNLTNPALPNNFGGSATGSGNLIGRIGGYGIEASLGIDDAGDAKTAAGFKLPFGFHLIYPDWEDTNRAIRDPNFRNRFGTDILRNIGDAIQPGGGKVTNPTIDDINKKLAQEAQERINRNPVGGFTVPRGVLGANQGVYAAVLNGKQGFLDKTNGKWYEYGSLSAEQKARLASDFINDPKQIARALPEGSYSRQSLYLPEFQSVQAPR